MDPDRVAAVVPLIRDALVEVEDLGVSVEEIDRCAQEYLDRLSELSAEMDETLAAVGPEDRKLVTNHEALGYFADRFGFEVIGAVVPSTSSLAEANPRDLDELEATMRTNGVKVIFAETTGANALAESLAARLGAGTGVVELYTESLEPGGDASDYLEMMRSNARLVADGLSGS
jgi:zinc/manganese transport system substrate-binding protein